MSIPFNKTYYDERELSAVSDCLVNGTDYISKALSALKDIYGRNVFLTASGSAAFELLFLALGLEPGGEVVMPSFTFPSAANAAIRAGLRPVFADIDRDTKVIDLNDAVRKITENTRCILPTHYGGSSADLDELKSHAKNALVIEDAALSFGAKFRGRPLAAIGDMGIISFHETKNVSGGEGGLLVVDKNNAGFAHKIQTLYDNGTDKQEFISGGVKAYTWRQPGMNVAMPNHGAALLFAQLEKAEEIRAKRKTVYEYYREKLTPLSEKYGFSLPAALAYNENNYHVFYLLFNHEREREIVRAYLLEKEIHAAFHYTPLHSSAMGRRLGYSPQGLPVTQSVSEGILRLPLYAGMTLGQCGEVVSALEEALCRI